MHLKLIEDKSNHIYVSYNIIEKYGIQWDRGIFHFGAWKTDIVVKIDNLLAQDTIGLSKGLVKNFTLPEEILYDIYIKENNFYLGPVIAYIAFRSQDKMAVDKSKKEFDIYLTSYENIKGLVFLCAKDSIDTTNKMIRGYYYSPKGNENTSCWKSGVFPYPDAVYNRTTISTEIYNDFFSIIGNKFFNTYSNTSFDKWELWKMLITTPHLQKHLPETVKLDSLNTLNTMLYRHQSIYLKPAVSTYSKGIIKVIKSKKGYIFIYPKKQPKARATIKRLIGTKKARELVKSLKEKNYIIQQGIKMKRYKKRGIDFRIIMQKNGKNQWNCMGIFAKLGKKGGIITNFTLAGYLLSGLYAFKKVFKMSTSQALEKMSELKNISFDICKLFDKYGNYADLGIDLMVDQREKVWILEVNTVDPYHKFPLFINDQQTYKKIVNTPLEYAKFLSGFKVNSDLF